MWSMILIWLLIVAGIIALYVVASRGASNGLRWGGLAGVIVLLIALAILSIVWCQRTGGNMVPLPDMPGCSSNQTHDAANSLTEAERAEARETKTMLENSRALNVMTANALAEAQQQLKNNQSVVDRAQQDTQSCLATQHVEREQVLTTTAALNMTESQLLAAKEANARMQDAARADQAEHTRVNNEMRMLQKQLEDANQRAAQAQREATRLALEVKTENEEQRRLAALARSAETQLQNAQNDLNRSQTEVTRLASVIQGASADLQQAHSALASTAALAGAMSKSVPKTVGWV